MKVGNKFYVSLARARMLRQARTRAFSRSRGNTAGRITGSNYHSSLKSRAAGNVSNTNLTSQIQEKSNYTLIRQCVDDMQDYAEKLLQTGKKSLFGLAMREKEENMAEKSSAEESGGAGAQNGTAESSGAEAQSGTAESGGAGAQNGTAESGRASEAQRSTEKRSEAAQEVLDVCKRDVIRVITGFVDAYNMAVARMNRVDDSTMKRYGREWESSLSRNRSMLSGMGITWSSNGTMRVDYRELEKTDISDIYKVFGAKNSLVEEMAQTAKNVEIRVENRCVGLRNTAYRGSSLPGSYNRYGNYDSGLLGRSWYNEWS